MVPVLTETGRSFNGAGAYYLHDKGAETTERVGWTRTENLPTNDSQKALKVMAWTAMHHNELKVASGFRRYYGEIKPVVAFSLSWPVGVGASWEHMLQSAQEVVRELGMEEHQQIFVEHTDEPHAHIHCLLNRVHPQTGKVNTLAWSKVKMQKWALNYEKNDGQIYCQVRKQNAEAREQLREEKQQGIKQSTAARKIRSGDPVILQAWEQADNGKAFQAALRAQGYELAQGRKRLVVVDRWGKTHNPVRQLKGVRAAEFQKRISDLDFDTLRKASVVEKLKQRANDPQAGKVSMESREEFNARSNPLEQKPTRNQAVRPQARVASRQARKAFNRASAPGGQQQTSDNKINKTGNVMPEFDPNSLPLSEAEIKKRLDDRKADHQTQLVEMAERHDRHLGLLKQEYAEKNKGQEMSEDHHDRQVLKELFVNKQNALETKQGKEIESYEKKLRKHGREDEQSSGGRKNGGQSKGEAGKGKQSKPRPRPRGPKLEM